MQFIIHSNRRDVMNVIGATSINSQNAFDALLRNFAQIKTKLNTKMSKIRELYELKEKNSSKMMSWTIMTKFFDMMKNARRHECANETKKANDCFERQVTRLKKMIRKLKKVIEKTKDTIERNIWTKIIVRQLNWSRRIKYSIRIEYSTRVLTIRIQFLNPKSRVEFKSWNWRIKSSSNLKTENQFEKSSRNRQESDLKN